MSAYAPGPASLHTRLLYERALRELPFSDERDEVDAMRGRLAVLPADLKAPVSVINTLGQDEETHPSLLRIRALRQIEGLFEVVPGVHQIRSLGRANVTVVDTARGRILIDLPDDRSLAEASIRLLDDVLTCRPVLAVLRGGTVPATDGSRVVVDGTVIDSIPIRDPNVPEVLRWFPQYGLLHAAESLPHSLPALERRGLVRDPLLWAKALNRVLTSHGEQVAVVVGADDWPTWGNHRGRQLISDQRDLLRFVHDEVLRLGYAGFSVDEIIPSFLLPPALAANWYARGYDGTLESHVRLLHPGQGFLESDASAWRPVLPPAVVGRLLNWVGGLGAAGEGLDRSMEAGDYNWVVLVGEQVLSAEPEATAIRRLTARAYQQLAYQEENLRRRAVFAERAQVLATRWTGRTRTRDDRCVADGDVERLLDHLAVRLNGPAAAGYTLRFRWVVEDSDVSYVMSLHNGALFAVLDAVTPVDATIFSRRAVLGEIACEHGDVRTVEERGAARIDGDSQILERFFGLLDPWACSLFRRSPTSQQQREH